MKPRSLAAVTLPMHPTRPRRSTPWRTAFLGGWLALAVTLHAGQGGFTATLSAEQQTAAGLPTLSPVELITLDQLVAGELAAVRRAGAPELTGSFVSRRSDAEIKAAGLDRLAFEQLEKLNEFVAAALAAHPKPKERPRLKDSDVLAPVAEKNQIHGSVTVGYGWGGGQSMWGESLWLQYYDPDNRFGIGVGLSNFNGNGYFGYGPDYPNEGRYYAPGPVSFDAGNRDGGPRGDFSPGDGQSFRGGWGGGRSLDFGGRHGH